MRSSTIEPGLLNIFRWFVAIRLSLLVLVAWSNEQNPDPTNPRFPEAGIFFFGILMIMLLWPRLQRVMGRAFLPVTLTIASLAPIVESTTNIEGRLAAGMSVDDAFADIWIPFFLLFVPLLLIAWQYRYRAVIVFAVGTTLLDLAATIPLVETATTNVAVLTVAMVGRGLLFAFVGLVVAKLASAQRQARRSLASHSTTLEHLATSRERNRLARELHDTLAHSLSGIAVQLEAVKTIWDDDTEQARLMLDQALADARSGLGEARRAIQTLRASPLEDVGLAGAIAALGENCEQRHGLEVEMSIADNIGELDPEQENAIYRIADEALTNIIRHAEANRVIMDLRRKSGKIRLRVGDDGNGFDIEGEPPDGHVGIRGMRERAEVVGGSLDITSGSEGTTVRFEVSPWK
jgi:signal transduction histidine kinase